MSRTIALSAVKDRPEFSLRKTGTCHMRDDILLVWSKMMVGHDGLLSG